jgi:hypothetical protein
MMDACGAVATIRRGVREIADNRQLVPVRLQRLEDLRHFKICARRLRLPFIDD